MDKILQGGRISILLLLIFFLRTPAIAQKDYGIPVIDTKEKYLKTVREDSSKTMVELKTLAADLVYDLRYASTNNFMHKRMYSANTRRTFLRKPAAEALAKVQQELREQGLGLKIYDAYRPYSVTVKFWELVKDERYVANPAKGSGHNRGLAIDLTLINLKTGNEIEMGTDFDNFSDTAHHSFNQLSPEVKQNRKLLRDVMKKYGFDMFDTEWWHYSWPNTKEFEVLDLKL